MDVSLLAAKLIGPVLLLMSVAPLFNRQLVSTMIDEVINSSTLLLFAGIMAFVPGLLLVNLHNIWVADWRIIITLFGWIALFAGVIRIVFPEQLKKIAGRMKDKTTLMRAALFINAALGGFLTLKGYGLL